MFDDASTPQPLHDPAGVAAGDRAGRSPGLSDAERLRYARHLVLPQVGEAGQHRLRAASVLVVGMGGLGCPVATMLAAAGVGRLGLVDADIVSTSNLQRQTLYTTHDVGLPKVVVACDRLQALNPHVRVEAMATSFTPQNAEQLLACSAGRTGWDLVIDATDNFDARYTINDACVAAGVPNIFGCIFQFQGRVTIFGAVDRESGNRGPCYRCVFPEPPPPGCIGSCAEAGVLGVLPGIVGNLQAMEAIKWLLAIGQPLVGRFLEVDALAMRFREIRVPRDPGCATCGHPVGLEGVSATAATAGGSTPANARTSSRSPAAASSTDAPAEISPDEFQRLLAIGEGQGPLVLDVRQPEECRPGDPGDLFIPIGALEARVHEVHQAIETRDRLLRHRGTRAVQGPSGQQPSPEVVAVCSAGVRSRHAVAILRTAGFAGARSLRGGLDAWRAARRVTAAAGPEANGVRPSAVRNSDGPPEERA